MATRESFKAALREYKKSSALSSDDHAHLQRWEEDDRTRWRCLTLEPSSSSSGWPPSP